jgi:hypothetical protein
MKLVKAKSSAKVDFLLHFTDGVRLEIWQYPDSVYIQLGNRIALLLKSDKAKLIKFLQGEVSECSEI